MHNLSLFVVPGFVAHILMYINAGGADESRNITEYIQDGCFSLLVASTIYSKYYTEYI